jgi:KDO2-lipid IV(A) lauroyltransferase
MKDKALRHRLEFLPYFALSRLLSHLPHKVVLGFGRALGRLGFAFDAGHRSIALRNLERCCPELGAGQRRRLLAACYRHFGEVFCEIFSVARLSEDQLTRRFDIEGLQHLEDAVGEGRGVMLLCGHFGNWQVAIYPLSLRLGGLQVVARPPNNPLVANDILGYRERFGVSVVARGGASQQILGIVRRGGRVGIVIDQRPPPGTGIELPFLGLPARTTNVPALIAIRARTPAVPVACVPVGDGRYRIRIREAIEAEGKGTEAATRLTRRYIEAIEEDIRDRPELYFWMHERWKQ